MDKNHPKPPLPAPLQPYLTIPGHTWPAQSHHVKHMLGLKKNEPLPAEGMPARHIQGITVWVRSLSDARTLGGFHRVWCTCPVCGKPMSLARLWQHSKIHPKE